MVIVGGIAVVVGVIFIIMLLGAIRHEFKRPASDMMD